MIIDALKVKLQNNRVFYDTNIWIFLSGYRGAPTKTRVYTAAHKEIVKGNNRIVTNEYVVSEFCHACARIEYNMLKEADPSIPEFKAYRRRSDFRQQMESVRDSCLNLLDECDFIPTSGAHYEIGELVDHFSKGEMDFNDILITRFCIKENLYLMSDDRDVWGKGVKLITYINR